MSDKTIAVICAKCEKEDVLERNYASIFNVYVPYYCPGCLRLIRDENKRVADAASAVRRYRANMEAVDDAWERNR